MRQFPILFPERSLNVNCREIQANVHAYIDGELDLTGSLELERHLQTCTACSQYHKNNAGIQAALRSPALYYPAPKSTMLNIHSVIQRESRSENRSKTLFVRLAVTSAFASVLFGAVYLLPRLNSANEASIQRDVVACHIRSLMVNHLADVISTDQHTVKPWFNGKLDFSPPVFDLKKEGFPLIGGRLDYLDEHAVSVLIYSKHKHIINLFVWQKKTDGRSGLSPITEFTRQGFHVVRWIQSDLQFWAVSDLNTAGLSEFARQFRNVAGGNK